MGRSCTTVATPEFAASEYNSRVAERQQLRELTSQEQSARRAYDLAPARYEGAAVDFVTVLDSQRALLQATFDGASRERRLLVRFVAINRALGNAPKLVR